MKIVKKSAEKIVFVEEIKESLANALRRSSSEIPVLAIDEVEIYKNDSVLNDQMLAHRIGLIPLKNEKLNLRGDCSCKGEGCQKCTIQLKLHAKGPKTVSVKDFKGKADPVYEEMPLVILDEDQELEFVAFARMGKGIEHAKYAPGLVFYRHIAQLGKIKEIPEKYKQQISFLEKEGNTFLVDLPESALSELEESGEVEPSSLLAFTIESFGQMEAREILLQSIKALRENLKHLEE